LAYLTAFHGQGWLILLVPGLLARAMFGLSLLRKCLVSALWGVLFTGLFHTWALNKGWQLWCCLLVLKGLPWALLPLPSGLARAERRPLFVQALAFGTGFGLVAGLHIWGPSGFDWETPMAALAVWPWCLATLPWLGLPGAALLMATCSYLLFSGHRQSGAAGAFVLVFWAGLSGLLYTEAAKATPNVALSDIALVQTGWSDNTKWKVDNRELAVGRLFRLSEQARARGARLVIWPEMAWPTANLRQQVDQARQVGALARRLEIDLLASSLEKTPKGWYNSATLVTPTGRFALEYRKRRLIPVQEYLPLPKVLERLLRERGWVLSSCHYLAGEQDVVFALGPSRYAVLICYESVVPWPAVRVGDQVDFLVVMANDSRLNSEFAREAHFRSAVLRAAELRLPVFQAANDGVSGVIDHRGVVLSRTNRGFQGAAVMMLAPEGR
jgi:apolipoprotein N-acyltransferase